MNRSAEMSRCGRGWATTEAAMASKRGQTGNYEAHTGCPCGRAHLRPTRDTKDRRPARVKLAAYRHKVCGQAIRALVLTRDSHCCVVCGGSILGRRYSLAHRLRASQGGKAVPSNLITAHGWGGQECHGAIDERKDTAYEDARGLTVRSGSDPRLVPVTYITEGGGFTRYLGDDGDLLEECPEVAA